MVLDWTRLLLGTNLFPLQYRPLPPSFQGKLFANPLSVFLFIDMFALTILYVALFVYIRLQLKSFRAATSSNTESTTEELRPSQANLEAGIPNETTASPHAILAKTTVTVMSEDSRRTYLSAAARARAETDRTRRRMNKVAVTLLLYPILYICLTMPLSITRLAQFAGNSWRISVVHAAAAIYCCSGWCNVLLYTLTRRGIISWNWLFNCGKKPPQENNPPPPAYDPGGSQGSATMKNRADE